jgi:hypothetical protein
MALIGLLVPSTRLTRFLTIAFNLAMSAGGAGPKGGDSPPDGLLALPTLNRG